MTTGWIVPPLDEREDCHTCFCLGLKLPTVEQFAFERCKEALTHRIVIGVTDRSHGRTDIRFLASQAEGD